jgi:hypothetical protein
MYSPRFAGGKVRAEELNTPEIEELKSDLLWQIQDRLRGGWMSGKSEGLIYLESNEEFGRLVATGLIGSRTEIDPIYGMDGQGCVRKTPYYGVF